MRIKFEIPEGKVVCESLIKEIPDEEIERVLEMHKKEKERKDINERALGDVKGAVEAIEQQLTELKKNVDGLTGKIKESQDKIDEPI